MSEQFSGDEKIWGKKWRNPNLGGAMEKPASNKKPEFMLVFLPGMGGCGKTNLQNAMNVSEKLNASVVTYSVDPLELFRGQENPDVRVWYQVPEEIYSMTALRFHPDVLKKGVYPNADKLPDQYVALRQMQAGSQKAVNEVAKFIRERCDFHDLEPKNVIVVGASQGAMVAAELAGKFISTDNEGKEQPLGMVMTCAGTLVNIEEMEKKAVKAKAKLVMFNGEKDVNVPFEGSQISYQVMRKAYGKDSESKLEHVTFPELDHTFFERQPSVITAMVGKANQYIRETKSKNNNQTLAINSKSKGRD